VRALSNLFLRVLVALVAIPIIVVFLFVIPPPWFCLLVATVAAWTTIELFRLSSPHDRVVQWLGGSLAFGAVIAHYFWYDNDRASRSLLIALPLIGLLIALFRPPPPAQFESHYSGLRVATFAFGPAYVAIPLSLLPILQRHHDARYAMFALILAWFSDTASYFGGRLWGRHALYPSISPKKTIEGAVVGLAGTIVAAILVKATFLRDGLSWAYFVFVGLAGGVLGQAGDMAESLLKRSAGVKDSGAILPGHGGFLDRLDCTIFTTVTTYFALLWWVPTNPS
jgi:phosphatidate cytidylyltransferase